MGRFLTDTHRHDQSSVGVFVCTIIHLPVTNTTDTHRHDDHRHDKNRHDRHDLSNINGLAETDTMFLTTDTMTDTINPKPLPLR